MFRPIAQLCVLAVLVPVDVATTVDNKVILLALVQTQLALAQFQAPAVELELAAAASLVALHREAESLEALDQLPATNVGALIISPVTARRKP